MKENTLNSLSLNAATAIHNDINGCDAWLGYEGTIDAFANLLAEVDAVVENLGDPDDLNVDFVVETWFEVQNEIAEGNLAVDWFTNPEAALTVLAAA
jgi:hypothetical protein